MAIHAFSLIHLLSLFPPSLLSPSLLTLLLAISAAQILSLPMHLAQQDFPTDPILLFKAPSTACVAHGQEDLIGLATAREPHPEPITFSQGRVTWSRPHPWGGALVSWRRWEPGPSPKRIYNHPPAYNLNLVTFKFLFLKSGLSQGICKVEDVKFASVVKTKI